MKTLNSVLFAIATIIAIAGLAVALEEGTSEAYARQSGAVGDGGSHDSSSFQQLLAQVKAGGILFIPDGTFCHSFHDRRYEPITIVETGYASQVCAKNDQTLFRFVNVDISSNRDVYLGSLATAGTSLIEGLNNHHNDISNVTMLDGYYGVHLTGSLRSTFIDLRIGPHFHGLFAPTSINNTWVMGEPSMASRSMPIPSSHPHWRVILNGIVLNYGNGQGSLQDMARTIEGVSGTGLGVQRHLHAFLV